MKCDFCSSTNVKWSYPAKSFPIGYGRSIGNWAACDFCYNLIEIDDRKGLLEWSLQTFEWINGNLPKTEKIALKHHIRALHTKFFENRTGKPVKL